MQLYPLFLLLAAVSALAAPKELEKRTTTASPLNEVSVLRVLETAVPESLLQLALTNSLSAIAEVKSEFSAGHTPNWFTHLPWAIQTYLNPPQATQTPPAYTTIPAHSQNSNISPQPASTPASPAASSTPATGPTLSSATRTGTPAPTPSPSTRLVVVTSTMEPSSTGSSAGPVFTGAAAKGPTRDWRIVGAVGMAIGWFAI